MASKLPWFRLYTEILDDKKIKRVCRVTGECKALVIGVWVILLALANDSDESGRLFISEGTPYALSDLSDETGLAVETLESIMNEFAKLGMLELCEDETLQISKWNSRQYKSDNSKTRVDKFRESQKQICNGDVTLQDRYSNNSVTPPETDTDTDTELNSSSGGEISKKPNVFSVYESEIGIITPLVAERLKMDADDYSENWVIDAINVASKNNIRKLSYIEGVLKSWHAQGKNNGERRAPPISKADKISAKDEHNEQVLKEVVNEIANTRRKER